MIKEALSATPVDAGGRKRRGFPAPKVDPVAPQDPVDETVPVEASPAPPSLNQAATDAVTATFERLEVLQIPLELVIPTPDNPRVIKHNAALQTLIASVKALGVLEPVLVRVHPQRPGCYDLRAGNRRYQAAVEAGLKTIPCRVFSANDAEAMSLTVIENMTQDPLHPLEEARGVQTLLELGWDEASIASKLDKSPEWVARRARLTKLIDPFRQAVMDPDHAMSETPIGVLERLARLDPKIQGQLANAADLKRGYRIWCMHDVRDFDQHINSTYLRRLNQAPFALDDQVLYPQAGSCAQCVKRSGCQPLLWSDDEPSDEGKPAGDRCLDPACFAEKSRRALKAKVAELTAEDGRAPILIDATQNEYGRVSAPIQKAFGGQVQTDGRWIDAAKTTAGARRALVINGPGMGKARWVKPRPSAGGGASRAHASAPGEKAPKPLRERRAELMKRRRAYVLDLVRSKVHLVAIGKPDASLPMPKWSTGELLERLTVFGTAQRRDSIYRYSKSDDAWKLLIDLRKKQVTTAFMVEQLTREVFRNLESRLTGLQNNSRIDAYWAEVQEQQRLLGFDLNAMLATAEKAIPEPKSWAHLNADGTPKSSPPAAGPKGGK